MCCTEGYNGSVIILCHFPYNMQLLFIDPQGIYPIPNRILVDISVKLICKSNKANWTFSHGHIPENVKIRNSMLFIPYIEIENDGTYECEGLTIEGEVFYAKKTVKVVGMFKVFL